MLITNKLRRFNTGSGNILTANIEQLLLVKITVAFCFVHTEHNLIELNSIINAVNKKSEYFGGCYVNFKQTNQICSLSKISQSINFAWRLCETNNQDICSCFHESK